MFAEDSEAAFFVERDRAVVPFPYAEPKGARAEGRSRCVNGAEEALRKTRSVPWSVDVEPPDFKGSIVWNHVRNGTAAKHSIGSKRVVGVFRDQCDHIGVGELARLLRDPVSSREIRGNVFGSIGGGERVTESSSCEFSERFGIGRDTATDGDLRRGHRSTVLVRAA